MSIDSPIFKSATELSQDLQAGTISSVEITQAMIDRIDAVDGQVHAFLHIDKEDALAQAKASDERRAKGESLSPLDGVPVGMKDVIAVKDQPLTAASKILENYRSPYDATVVRKLKDAGAVVAGRLNLDEFAMGSSTENSAYGPTRNPWNLDCVPGGKQRGEFRGSGSPRSTPDFGFRYRWIHPPARLPLWCGGDEANLWDGFPLRIGRLCFLPRSDRSVFHHRGRCRPPS